MTRQQGETLKYRYEWPQLLHQTCLHLHEDELQWEKYNREPLGEGEPVD